MSIDTLEKLLSEVFMHQKVIGVDICGECSLSEPLQQRETIMKEYDRETQLWNSVYAESPSVDLRTENLSVEVMFDVCPGV